MATVELAPLPLPAGADAARMKDFGRYVIHLPCSCRWVASSDDIDSEVKNLHPGKLTPEQLEEVKKLLYTVFLPLITEIWLVWPAYQYNALLFRDVVVTPEEQYALTKV